MSLKITQKKDHKSTIAALQTKRAVGTLSEERKQIRKAIEELNLNKGLEIYLEPQLIKNYVSKDGKKNKTHPTLDKIRLEIKDYNNINKDSKGLYIILYTANDVAHITKHRYDDIKNSITTTKTGSERVNFSRYLTILENL